MHSVARPLKFPPILPLDKGLVLHLPFDERSGVKVYDRSGKRNHGTISGALWKAGKRGSALNFDGVDDDILVPDAVNLRADSEVTVAAWIKTSTAISYCQIAAKTDLKEEVGATYDYSLYVTAGSTRVDFYLYNTADVLVTAKATFTFNDGLWHLLVGTASASLVAVYIDAALKATNGGTTDIRTSTRDLHIGGAWTGKYAGLMRDVRVYNRALNAAEIKRLYESELRLVRH